MSLSANKNRRSMSEPNLLAPPPTANALAERRLVYRTRGRRHGPVTRLMSPSDLGELLRPFVFLDHFDTAGGRSEGLGLHPHSGIATVTWIMEGNVSYEDTTGDRHDPTGLEGCRPAAGSGTAAGSAIPPHPVFQLWLALPLARAGPGAKPLPEAGCGRPGRSGKASAPAPSDQLPRVSLKAGERWTSAARVHTVATAVSRGSLRSPEALQAGELALFEESSEPIAFYAETDAELVVGSAVKHPHDLVLGYYSVHTSADALREGEARIQQIGSRLREEGRLT
jgi:redox-sensitive bicupin YhaK (pirin superfamily)